MPYQRKIFLIDIPDAFTVPFPQAFDKFFISESVNHIRDFYGLIIFFQKGEPVVNNFFYLPHLRPSINALTEGRLIVMTSEKGKKLEWVKKYFQILNGSVTKGQLHPCNAPLALI
jgi:hypothetical protein